jgi:hypothetical protein
VKSELDLNNTLSILLRNADSLKTYSHWRVNTRHRLYSSMKSTRSVRHVPTTNRNRHDVSRPSSLCKCRASATTMIAYLYSAQRTSPGCLTQPSDDVLRYSFVC